MNDAPATVAAHPGMRPIDEIAAEPERCVTTLETSRSRPHVGIEILSDLHFGSAPSKGSEAEEAGESAALFARRYQKLREPFAESDRHLVICRGGISGRAAAWPGALGQLEDEAVVVAALDAEKEMAAIFGVRLAVDENDPERSPDRTLKEPFAYVVLFAWPEVLADGRAAASEGLLRTLTGSVARNAPLHALCIARCDGETPTLVRECERLQVSVVLAGSAGDPGLVTSSRAGLTPGQAPRSVAVAHCPGFRAGSLRSGMTRLRLDVWKGAAEIAFRRDLGSDRPEPPVQVVTPLHSISRVASSERRLRSHVDELLVRGREKAAADTKRMEKIEEFEGEVETLWEKSGYVALCRDDGEVPLPVTRHTRYHLLLLVREREGGGYDLMLSNHTPLRPSLLSDWNTLLLPAFKDVRALLEHLRDDVVRQAVERAEDVERVTRAKQFEEAVGRILDDEEKGHGDELWAEELREVASRQIRKISPTTGAVTEFDYHLVTLLPLVDRATAEADAGSGDRKQLNDRRRIIEWLDRLDTVVLAGESKEPARELPLEALEENGCGLRWDPQAGLAAEPGAEERRRRRSAAPGAVWFPLGDGEEEPWRGCPSILSRNADVIKWAADQLNKARANHPRLPDELVLGKYGGGSDVYRSDPSFPFDSEETEPDPEKPGLSTVDALQRVRLLKGFDLEDEKAYAGAEFKRVFLRREKVGAAGVDRDGIYVYEARAGEGFGPEVAERGRLGILRPVQRYVLRAGLERAQEINDQVLPRLAEEGDAWGYLRVRKGAAPQSVAVTPPLIEQAWHGDLDDLSESGLIEFVVCDGNHRIVEGVWMREGAAMPAVAVVGDLPRPYYARPFGRLEWDATAENELPVTPDLASKYLARKVDWEKDLDDAGREILADVHKTQWYRRYFRDLETGFGYMGGQGGRW